MSALIVTLIMPSMNKRLAAFSRATFAANGNRHQKAYFR